MFALYKFEDCGVKSTLSNRECQLLTSGRKTYLTSTQEPNEPYFSRNNKFDLLEMVFLEIVFLSDLLLFFCIYWNQDDSYFFKFCSKQGIMFVIILYTLTSEPTNTNDNMVD